MCDDQSWNVLRGQFLGEIETEIVGRQHHQAVIQPSEHLNLEREPENPHDKNAIRVDNGRFQPAGYLPRAVASWLAPLLDSGKIRIEGYLPAKPATSQVADSQELPVVLMVFLGESGPSILDVEGSQDRLNALHELALQAYSKAQSFADPEVLLAYAASLEPLAREDLLPETRLVLALILGMAREIRAVRTVQALATLHAALNSLLIGEPICRDGLTLYPLSWPDDGDPPYLLLSRAIDRNLAMVEEVSEAGSVPSLRLHNKSLRPILIPEGEILVGGKQNRVVNITVLVAAKSLFTLPVSCVEQGRWQYRSRSFRSRYCAPPGLRAKKLRSVHENRRRSGKVVADEGEVWDEVARSLHAAQVQSSPQSLTDGLAATSAKGESIHLPANTAGVVVAYGERIIGADLFDAAATFQALWERLAQAYFFDAHRHSGANSRVADPSHVRAFLRSAADHARVHAGALGLGEELEISGGGQVGTRRSAKSKL